MIAGDRLEALRRGDTARRRSVLSSSLRMIVAHWLALRSLLWLVGGIRVGLVATIVNGVTVAGVDVAWASKALRVTGVMTSIGRLLHGVRHRLIHTVRLLGPTLIVELLGRVLRRRLMPLRLGGSGLGLGLGSFMGVL